MSSATPPSTTSRDSPKLERPAVSAKGTVRPSERPMMLGTARDPSARASDREGETYTSRTTSGSMRWRSSSPLSSLQQTPSRLLLCLSHLAGRGVSPLDCSEAMDQIGGRVGAPSMGCARRGSGTERAVGSIKMEVEGEEQGTEEDGATGDYTYKRKYSKNDTK